MIWSLFLSLFQIACSVVHFDVFRFNIGPTLYHCSLNKFTFATWIVRTIFDSNVVYFVRIIVLRRHCHCHRHRHRCRRPRRCRGRWLEIYLRPFVSFATVIHADIISHLQKQCYALIILAFLSDCYILLISFHFFFFSLFCSLVPFYFFIFFFCIKRSISLYFPPVHA